MLIIRDANGQALAYVYFENEPGRRSVAKLLTLDEARRIADYRSYCAQADSGTAEEALALTGSPALRLRSSP